VGKSSRIGWSEVSRQVNAGLVVKFSFGYWTISALALAIQLMTVWLVFILNRKHFRAA
jgi:hypothetical protein